jgi:hypothetical protein
LGIIYYQYIACLIKIEIFKLFNFPKNVPYQRYQVLYTFSFTEDGE